MAILESPVIKEYKLKEEILRRKFYREQLERQGGPDIPSLISCEGMTDSEKNDFINFIYGQLKEREAQNEALHSKLDAQMERYRRDSTGIKSSMSTDDGNRTNLASNKIHTSRSWNYWFERATSNGDMAACRF